MHFGNRYPARNNKPQVDGEQLEGLDGQAGQGKPPARSVNQYACWLLGLREWSAKELAARLALKGYSAEDIAKCLEFCQRHGLQSDERYARSRVNLRSNAHGNQRILRELRQKGIDPDSAQLALGHADSEQERALKAAQRFAGREMTPALKNKAWRFLMSRGFSSASIKSALTEIAVADVNFTRETEAGQL